MQPSRAYPPPEELRELADRMIRAIRTHRSLASFSDHAVDCIVRRAKELLATQNALIELHAPINIFGDIHGQLDDMLRICGRVGEPPQKQWLFLGDYVDRCKKGFEVVMFLFCFKIKYPDRVHMTRGNHECQKTNRLYGFYYEMQKKRSVALYTELNRVFNELPLVASVDGRLLCMHGGISQDIKSWETLRKLKKPKTMAECDEGVALDLMWADPTNETCAYRFNNARATSVLFGDSAMRNFCAQMNIALIVRAHEAVAEGYQFTTNKRCVTLFSAPNYCGQEGNAASVMQVAANGKIKFSTFKPRLDAARVPFGVRARLRTEKNVRSPNVTGRAVPKFMAKFGSLFGSSSRSKSKKKNGHEDADEN